jgi:predicted ATPase/class 3 adenylate cyclase
MSELPRGTVTLLFTDVDGSTRLLQELGRERYIEALEAHRRMLRDAFQRHGGVEVEMQGDSFFFAFASALKTVVAAAEAQQALASHEWDGEPIRVRIGIHTGEPTVVGRLYAGLDVHRAARVMAAGHGGQVLLSQATRELLDGDVSLRDLGDHRLKDLLKAEHLYQVGDEEFPVLKSLNRTNLPIQPTPFVGRERELAEILGLLGRSRLVTLTGAGGSGKTRLALQAVAELAGEQVDGVWFVSLAAVADPDLVEATIAQVVGAREDDLRGFLRDRDLLLLLDNLEHLLPEVAQTVPNLGARVLATSRERLNVAGEQEYEVSTLPVDDAVALFTQRARQLRPSFEPDEKVAEVVRRLDGLPLAVELAAALIKVLTVDQIAMRVAESLAVLTMGTRDAPERQRTLRATIDWSYELLTVDEHRAFARLGVFAGSFDLEAAESVVGADLEVVANLVDKSLLRQTGEGRFFMLETIRAYAIERLEQSGLAGAIRQRHADWVGAFALRARDELRGERQAELLDRLTIEHANVRAALAFAIDSGDAQLALTIAGGLGRFWVFRGHEREGWRWLQAALAFLQQSHDEVRWRALYWGTIIADGQRDKTAALALAEEALTLGQELRDAQFVMSASLEVVRRSLDAGDYERAKRQIDESVRVGRELGDEEAREGFASIEGQILLYEGQASAAATRFEEGLAWDRRSQDTHRIEADLSHLALTRAVLGEGDECRSLLRECAALLAGMKFPYHLAMALQAAAQLALSEDDALRAGELFVRADGLLDAIESTATGVEGALYERTRNLVKQGVGDAQFENLRLTVPLGDHDEALGFLSAYVS